MAKAVESTIKTSNKAVLKSTTKQKGAIACICNICGAKVEVPTSRFYAHVAPARESVKDKDGKRIVDFVAKGSLRHNRISGGSCEGTFKTVKNENKTKSHKASRDRPMKSKQK